jgi:YbbR domain-containing protein
MSTGETSKDKEESGEPGLRLPSGINSPQFNRSLGIFLICLVFATILWFLNALSKNYTITVTHPVLLTNLPRNTFIANNPPDRLNLKVHAYGFELLRYKLSISFLPITLEVDKLIKEVEPSTNGFYIINSNDIKESISLQLGSEIQLLEISPATFTLAFDSLGVKQVPVGSQINLGFRPRFDLIREIEFKPPFVTVSGPQEIITEIDTVYTVPRTFKNLDAPFSQEIVLVIPRQAYIEPQKVKMKADIEEFTEKSMSVPVWIDKQPENIRLRLFPNEVEVNFKTGLSQYALIKPEDFGLYVSWDDINSNLQSLKVKISKLPAAVKSVKISPENVEYLIEKN